VYTPNWPLKLAKCIPPINYWVATNLSIRGVAGRGHDAPPPPTTFFFFFLGGSSKLLVDALDPSCENQKESKEIQREKHQEESRGGRSDQNKGLHETPYAKKHQRERGEGERERLRKIKLRSILSNFSWDVETSI
jgi:hypothetical protein